MVYPSNTADPRVALKTARVPGFVWLQLPPACARLRARGGLPPGLGAGAGGLAAGPGAAPRGGADAAAPGVRHSTKSAGGTSAGGTAAFAGGNEGMSRANKLTRGAFGHHLGDMKKILRNRQSRHEGSDRPRSDRATARERCEHGRPGECQSSAVVWREEFASRMAKQGTIFMDTPKSSRPPARLSKSQRD